jgi:hypothetical protein
MGLKAIKDIVLTASLNAKLFISRTLFQAARSPLLFDSRKLDVKKRAFASFHLCTYSSVRKEHNRTNDTTDTVTRYRVTSLY